MRIGRIDSRVIDSVLAVGLGVGAVVDAHTVVPQSFHATALVACAACTGSVAWRRAAPLAMAIVACGGYVALVLFSRYDGGGTFEFAAVAFTFYTFGRSVDGRTGTLVAVGLCLYWLVGSVVVFYVPAGGTPGVVAALWATGVVPLVIGHTLVTRSRLISELASSAAQLEDEQSVRVRRAVAEERQRVARELHDVVAHCVSVMVVQTAGARSVASADLAGARAALDVVERAGRDALVELRRMIGVVRRDGGRLAGESTARLSQLSDLLDRCRAAGLPVELAVQGTVVDLAPGLDLVAYRVVQEALTNALKHAGPTSARVAVSYTARALELNVTDNGRGADAESQVNSGGHGLVGMRERVALFGGELHAGQRPGGGFEVRARIPLDGSRGSAANAEDVRFDDRELTIVPPIDRLHWPWLDPLLAALALVVFEVAILTSESPRGPLALNVLVAACMALSTMWRRRWPVHYAVAMTALNWVMTHELTPLNTTALSKAIVFVWPTYAVAAWTQRRTAVAWLLFVLLSIPVTLLIGRPGGNVAGYAGVVLVFVACWATGRAIRARRLLTLELQRTSARLRAEREDRARLAIAGERSRIARELHALVARSVAAMVVQTEAARTEFEHHPGAADAAMEALENAGRSVLADLRRILGVLRHPEAAGQRAPQPGVDQIYTLIQDARTSGQSVQLSVAGDPGTLPAGVELGVYRILEEALTSARRQSISPINVSLRFADTHLEMGLSARAEGPTRWPTEAMRERISMCGGELQPTATAHREWQILARIPRTLQGTPA